MLLVSVLSACSIGIRSLKVGKAVRCYWLKSFDHGNVIFDNALLHFYVRVGALEDARKVFDEMPKRDVVSWSTMVGGFVQWGFCENAISVFDEIVRGGDVDPNEATVAGLLAACASPGSLSLCEQVHAYVCGRHDLLVEGNVGNALVNSYVKCGSIRRAIYLFKTLRFKDEVSWSTMISGVAMSGLGHHTLPLFGLMLVNGVAPDDVTFLGLLTACSHAGLVDEGLMVFNAWLMHTVSPLTSGIAVVWWTCMHEPAGSKKLKISLGVWV